MNNEDVVEQWAIVELMGHKVVAGYVAKSEMFGKPLLRVDVPATSLYSAYTQFYGIDAVYCITPVSEAVAKTVAESHKIDPVSVYTPELVTREQHEEALRQLREQVTRMRDQRALPGRSDDEF